MNPNITPEQPRLDGPDLGSDSPVTNSGSVQHLPLLPIEQQGSQTEPTPTVTPPPTVSFDAPMQPAQPPVVATVATNPGLIILQWLTYAFWGWTVLALSILTASVIASFIAGADTSAFTPYGIAAVLVLLPISYVCDSFYSKREPQKKVGVEVLVMVVHAVIFALFGIGSLIAAVFAVVQLATSSSDSASIIATLVTALIIAAYYGLTFIRTLNPAIIPWMRRFFKIIMLISVGIIALLGLIGPVAKERTTRDDKLISSELSLVSSSIDNYASTNDKLPTDLNTLKLGKDAKLLISKELVTYKPETASTSTLDLSTGVDSLYAKSVYRYQLCVNYKKESVDYGRYSVYNSYEQDGYATSPSTYDHPAGAVCYKLKTSSY